MNILRRQQSKSNHKGQTPSGDEHRPKTKDDDRIYALLRRLGQKVSQLESEVSTIRRDLNATRRKVYREDGSPLIKEEPVGKRVDEPGGIVFPLPYG